MNGGMLPQLLGTELVGHINTEDGLASATLVYELVELMKKYHVNTIDVAWSHFPESGYADVSD